MPPIFEHMESASDSPPPREEPPYLRHQKPSEFLRFVRRIFAILTLLVCFLAVITIPLWSSAICGFLVRAFVVGWNCGFHAL